MSDYLFSLGYFSIQKSVVYNPDGDVKIITVDCGMKYNQIRCLVSRGACVEVVPWNYDFNKGNQKQTRGNQGFTQQLDNIWICICLGDFDGVFLSNGPGDPTQCTATIENIRRLMNNKKQKPIFGICLGHQLLSLAVGCKTYKMK
jgi:carbamoyl-phosphate synthase/aspartate carbamoyltransferase/dihydroorotase